MYFIRKRILLFIFLFAAFRSYAQFQFISPLPNSANHHPDRCIIIREGHVLNENVLQNKSLFSITGSKSGRHDFTLDLSNDHRTIILKPLIPFSYSEKLTVQLKNGLLRSDGLPIPSLTFSFFTHRKYSAGEQQQINDAVKSAEDEDGENAISVRTLGNVTVSINMNPAPGDVIYDFEGISPINPTGCDIITSNGDSVFSFTQPAGIFTDFKINHNGYFTFLSRNDSNVQMLDSSYHLIKTFKPANGYILDSHEFQIFPDGHYYLIALDDSIIDMTQFNPAWNSHAVVMGTVIQEFDGGDHLIFEWRSFDHVSVLEAENVNLAAGTIDYIHTNSIDEDTDGNIIVSNRNIDQINKINVNSGNFIWRLGGDSNQFAFTNDPNLFNYQHDARRIANGDLTLFDNNNFGSPNTATAKEYSMDLVNKTVTLQWSYQHPLINGANIISRAMGSVQRLSNGGTFIDWGFIANATHPSFTEVDSSNNIVWEGKIIPNTNIAYRAHREVWTPCARVSDQTLQAVNIGPDTATLTWSSATNAASYQLQYRDSGNISWTGRVVNAPDTSFQLTDLKSGTTYEWQIQTLCNAPNPEESNFTAIKKFTTSFGTGINSASIPQIKLFPNPANEFVLVDFGNAVPQSSELLLINELGETVLDEHVSSVKNNQLKIPLTTISAGIYEVKVISNEKTFFSKLLVEK